MEPEMKIMLAGAIALILFIFMVVGFSQYNVSSCEPGYVFIQGRESGCVSEETWEKIK